MKRVTYIFPISHHYRLPFHQRLRALLAEDGVEYIVVYCEPNEDSRKKKDTVEISWGIKVPRTDLPGGMIYQHGLRHALSSDLVILQQENSLVINYLLAIASAFGLKQIAYFGHGRNFQSRSPDGWAERWKRFWATKTDWWFAYTEETRRHVESIGFPSEQITVFNNSIDTTEIELLTKAVKSERISQLRIELGIEGAHVGVYVGGLYPDKRLEFLVKAGELVRDHLPDFKLIVVGGGKQLPLMEKLASTRPWIKLMGPRFASDKIELMMLGKLFLMPGLVGLAILDAGALGLPTITTGFPYHSPEIAYLEDGVNGIIVKDWRSPVAYASAIVGLFMTPERIKLMSDSARATSQAYSIEAMAKLFKEGILKALKKHELYR